MVDRGVPPQDIMVGSGGPDDGRLHMSFLVFEGETEDEPWAAAVIDVPPAGSAP